MFLTSNFTHRNEILKLNDSQEVALVNALSEDQYINLYKLYNINYII